MYVCIYIYIYIYSAPGSGTSRTQLSVLLEVIEPLETTYKKGAYIWDRIIIMYNFIYGDTGIGKTTNNNNYFAKYYPKEGTYGEVSYDGKYYSSYNN